jgi:uncharacterized protein (TIGR03435 family)
MRTKHATAPANLLPIALILALAPPALSAPRLLAQTPSTPADAQPTAASPATPPGPSSSPNEASGFEVATIKPSDPDLPGGKIWGTDGRRLQTRNSHLKWLIQWAYGIQGSQIVEAPDWSESFRFDVMGEIEGTKVASDPEWRIAMQKLLADRFQLQFHHETREMPAYVLVTAKGGPKLTRSDPEKDLAPILSFQGAPGQTMRGFGRDVTLGQYFGEVQRLTLDRPLSDQTGITGTFNITMLFTRAGGDPSAPEVPDAPPDIFGAVQEQLGLELKKTTAPVDVLVIDHAEKPSLD